MQKVFGRLGFECGIDCEVTHSFEKTSKNAAMHTFDIAWDYEKVTEETKISITLREDAVGHLYYWNPTCGFKRSVPCGWIGGKKSMTSISAPVSCIYDGKGINRFTVAVSEVKEIVELKTAIVNDSYFGMEININLNQYVHCGHLTLKVLIDETQIPMHEAIDNVRAWWEEECDLQGMKAPEDAKDAMYSYWYSFQQALFNNEVLEEAKRVAELGLKTVILDDGWQMEGVDTRFAYTGDWYPHEKKFPNFRESIDKIHDLGLKVILWVGIPYIGEKAENWEIFKDKTIQYSDWARASILDPRYPVVREHIISSLIRLIKDYNLDGFKLDFIDLFYDVKDSKISDEMDFLSVQEAVDCLMVEIKRCLLEINPDVMIEFRQKYIGPSMRKYGNMFRVEDCPDDYLSNKIGVIDLRLLSGNTAVHSDMLMWNESETVERAALQIINVIFGTMQFSGRLSKLSDEHKAMVKFWMTFMEKNKDVLLNAPIKVEEPHLLYTVARTEKASDSVVAVYAIDKCIKLNEEIKRTTIVNGTESTRVIVENNKGSACRLTVTDCKGNVVNDEHIALTLGMHIFDIPVAGTLTLDRVE